MFSSLFLSFLLTLTITLDRDQLIAGHHQGTGNDALQRFHDLPAVMAEKQEAGSTFARVGFKTAGDLSQHFGWAEGSLPKVLLHAGVGGLAAHLAGGKAEVGATVSAANEWATPHLAQVNQTLGFKPGTVAFDSALQLGSALLGSAAGRLVGGQGYEMAGSALAVNATQNNYLRHYELVQYGLALNKCQAKDRQACQEAKEWEKLSKERDQALVEACSDPANQHRCTVLTREAQKADAEYARFFKANLGTHLKGFGYQKGNPGQLYRDNSPHAALQNAKRARDLKINIERELQSGDFTPHTKSKVRRLAEQILKNPGQLSKQNVRALELLRNDLRMINATQRGQYPLTVRYAAQRKALLNTYDGDLPRYLRISGQLNARGQAFAGSLDGHSAGALSSVFIGKASDYLAGKALAGVGAAFGSIKSKMTFKSPVSSANNRVNGSSTVSIGGKFSVSNPIAMGGTPNPSSSLIGTARIQTTSGNSLQHHLTFAENQTLPTGKLNISGGVNGAHNIYHFQQAIADGNGLIVSSTRIAPGIYQVKYKVPRLYANGPNADQPIRVNGVIQYKSKLQAKTVYDPAIHSDAEMADMAHKAAILGFPKAKVQYVIDNEKRKNISTFNGIDFTFYLSTDRSGNIIITNSHPGK